MRGIHLLNLIMLLAIPASSLAEGDLFQEDFNDGTAEGFSAECALWSVTPQGTYQIENYGYEVYCWTTAGNVTWSDYTFSGSLRTQYSVNQIVAFRVQDNGDGYWVNLRSHPWNDAVLTKWKDSTAYHLLAVPFSNLSGVWHEFKVSLVGDTIQFDADGQEVFTYSDSGDPFLQGKIGLVSYTGGVAQHQVLDVDNIQVDSFVVPVTSSTLSSVKALYR